MSEKVTYKDLLEVSHGIRECIKLPGKEFALACVKNHKLIVKHMDKFNSRFPTVEGFDLLNEKFQQGQKATTPENRLEFESAFKEEHKELIEKQEKLEAERDLALQEVVEGFEGWNKIKNSVIPHAITVEQLSGIEKILV